MAERNAIWYRGERRAAEGWEGTCLLQQHRSKSAEDAQGLVPKLAAEAQPCSVPSSLGLTAASGSALYPSMRWHEQWGLPPWHS